ALGVVHHERAALARRGELTVDHAVVPCRDLEVAAEAALEGHRRRGSFSWQLLHDYRGDAFGVGFAGDAVQVGERREVDIIDGEAESGRDTDAIGARRCGHVATSSTRI